MMYQSSFKARCAAFWQCEQGAFAGSFGIRVAANKLAKLRAGLIRRIFKFRKFAIHRVVIAAATVRRKLLPRVTFIGITGSCGKTTATLLTGAILSAKRRCQVRAYASTEPSIARTLLTLVPSTQFCVHEVGAYELGSIARSVGILRPQIGIVTTVGTDHYRLFRGLEGVAREKAALVKILPQSGAAILNIDDPHVCAMAAQTKARVVTFGLSDRADIRATNVSSIWPDRLSLTVIHGGERARIRTKLVGEHWVASILAAIACGIACGVSFEDCIEAVEKFEPLFARYSVHSRPGAPVYVLDTRKAPAWTISYGLDFIANARAPRKTIVFGTISDISGKGSRRYRKVAQEALKVADRVVFVGPNANHVEKMRQGEATHRLFSFLTAYEASRFLSGDALPNELILVKSSISDHLERLMLHCLDDVVCWKQPCGQSLNCPQCPRYHTPSRPPFNVATDDASQAQSTDSELR